MVNENQELVGKKGSSSNRNEKKFDKHINSIIEQKEIIGVYLENNR
jgi:hypothetical protein